jgi:hypothetical protein
MIIKYETSFNSGRCLTDCPHSAVSKCPIYNIRISPSFIRVGSVSCQRCEYFICRNEEKHEVECLKDNALTNKDE